MPILRFYRSAHLYTGFNDLCIYPPSTDMAGYKDPNSKDTKGIFSVYYGHTNQNQTGK